MPPLGERTTYTYHGPVQNVASGMIPRIYNHSYSISADLEIAGCFQGMLVQGNSEEVGMRTTNAVVQSIFLVIVLDAVFAVFFSSIGWR